MSLVHHDVSNCWQLDCLLNSLIRRTTQKTSKLRTTGRFEQEFTRTYDAELWSQICGILTFCPAGFQANNIKEIKTRHHCMAIFEQETTSDSWILFTKGLLCSNIHNLRWLFKSLFRITTSKIWKLRITGSLKGEATRNWLMHLTKNLLCKVLILNFHQLDCLFNSLFRLTPTKISKPQTAGYLIRKSTSDWCLST